MDIEIRGVTAFDAAALMTCDNDQIKHKIDLDPTCEKRGCLAES
jgi:hypothetical protein